MALLAQHFRKPHRRAFVMSIVASGSSLGGTLHPIMLNNLFNGGVGFANGVRASAGLIGGCLVLAICVMHPRQSDRRASKNKAENGSESDRSRDNMAKDDKLPGMEPVKISLSTAIKKFLKDPPFMLLALS